MGATVEMSETIETVETVGSAAGMTHGNTGETTTTEATGGRGDWRIDSTRTRRKRGCEKIVPRRLWEVLGGDLIRDGDR